MIKKVKGFTVIELIVVIAIIGILSSIVYASVSIYLNKAKDTKIKANISQITKRLATYYADHQNFPASKSEIISTDIQDDYDYNSDPTPGSGAFLVFSKVTLSNKLYWAQDSLGAFGSLYSQPGDDAYNYVADASCSSTGCDGTDTSCYCSGDACVVCSAGTHCSIDRCVPNDFTCASITDANECNNNPNCQAIVSYTGSHVSCDAWNGRVSPGDACNDHGCNSSDDMFHCVGETESCTSCCERHGFCPEDAGCAESVECVAK